MLRRALLWVISAFLAAAPGCASSGPGFSCGTPPNVVGCESNEVCVSKELGASRTYECVENPCGAATLSCEKCAAPACGGLICANAKGHTVNCYCHAC
jgi:hypothetical protein